MQKDAAAEVPGVLQLSLKVMSMSDEALELLAWVLDDPTFKLYTKNKSEVWLLWSLKDIYCSGGTFSKDS